MAKQKKKKSFNVKNAIYLSCIIIFAIVVVFIGVKKQFFTDKQTVINKQESVSVDEIKDLKVTFIDVGQGDGILVNFPDGKNMLVDFNECDTSVVDKYLTENGEKMTIDYLVATHPDYDHIGKLQYVYDNYEVKYSFRPYVLSEYESSSKFNSDFNLGVDINQNSKAYYNYINSVYEYNRNSWEFFKNDSDFSCDVIVGENTYTYSVDFVMPYINELSDYSSFNGANNFSAIIMIEYAGRKILFTGDAENEDGSKKNSGAEYKFYDYYSKNNSAYVDCDVLKVAHHGSKSSSDRKFLNLVKPEYAVISCGVGNNYSHPAATTLNNLMSVQSGLSGVNGTGIYRTDIQGSVTLKINSSGDMNFSVETTENDAYKLYSCEQIKANAEEINANKEKVRKS
ncbi:MAG: hypothetical protein J5836_01975 [Clostridia bacterium]|nr:hypothetical protein [Clostridia bacterium]